MVQTVEDQTSAHVRYRVIVRGRLGEYLADVFDQLEVDARPGQTSLTGNFADQAQLHGLLDQLRESLKRTPDERLRELEANVAFLSVLQSSVAPKVRGDGR